MLKTLIAKYPLIDLNITIIDRERTLDNLKLIGDELSVPVYLRSLLQSKFELLGKQSDPLLPIDPIKSIVEEICSLHFDTNGLYIFENLFASILAVSPLEREICYQALSNLFSRLNRLNRKCFVIFMESGRGEVPAFLRQIIWAYKFPLPTNLELTTLLLEYGINIEDSPRLFNVLGGLTLEEITVGIRANQDLVNNLEELGDRLLSYKHVLFKSFGLEFIGDTTTQDIGGMDLVKIALEEVKMDFSPEARECGLPMPRGWILVGIPGAGKTYFAKICSMKLGLPLINIGIDVVKSGGVVKFKELLNRIDACAPNMPYLDEFDKFFADEHGKELLGILLTWLNEKTSKTFVLATLNRLENLPPELTRAGRFDRVFHVDFPSEKERKEILQLHCGRFDRRYKDLTDGALDIGEWLAIIESTNKYTGAELAQIAIVAAKSQFYRGIVPIQIDLKSLIDARAKVRSLYARNPESVLAIENTAKAFTEPSSSNQPTEFDLPPVNFYRVSPG